MKIEARNKTYQIKKWYRVENPDTIPFNAKLTFQRSDVVEVMDFDNNMYAFNINRTQLKEPIY